MKDKFLQMAGVNSEEEFYSMFPTEEAFFQAYPEARKMKKGGNVPTNPGLYSRVKSEVKSEFDTWPSAYGSAALVREYKSRGGGYRKAQTGGGLQDQQIFQYPNYDQNMMAYMQKTQQDEQNNPMGAIGNMLYNGAMAIGQNVDNAAQSTGGGAEGGGGADKMQMAKLAMNFMGMPSFQMGGTGMMMRDNYYDEGGEMAIGQIMAMHDKLSNLQKFVNGDTEVEPWVASKITLADDYLNSVSEYMQYNEGNEGPEEEEDTDMNMGEMEEMKMGGIPQRYKSRGFTKVGAKRKSDRSGKKWMVLAKKGDKYKIVHGGYVGMKDFSQHGSNKRKDNFWNRMGGKDSAKANDPFSPLYWHKRFGTWAYGGQPEEGGPVKEVPFKAITDAENKKARNKKALDIGTIAATIAGSIGMIAADARLARGKNRYRDEHPGVGPLGAQHPDPTMRQKWDLGKRAYGGDIDMYGGQMDIDAMYNMMKGGQPCYECGGKVYQQGGQQDEVMQAIQMYAQMTQTDPEQLMAQLQALPPLEQQEAIQKIMQAIQEAQQGQSPQMAYGGININPANKGKFTASANRAGMGVQEFASKVLANKEDYSSTQVKRANFARNAAGWKKQMGGMTQGSELELDNDEIQNLIDQGYGIEYLD